MTDNLDRDGRNDGPRHWAGIELTPERLPLVMGIVNVTPDSFSDGGQWQDPNVAIDHAMALVAEGADILDVGGESTRPGSDAVALDDELARVVPVIEGIAARTTTPISIDTRKAAVMRAAIEAGATIVNDVSALTFDPDALATIADHDCPIVLMHAKGDPKTMQDDPVYDDVCREVAEFLAARVVAAVQAGVAPERIAIDPGIGFGKTLEHNLALLKALKHFQAMGQPVLLGASRKRFIGTLSGVAEPADRVHGSVAVALHGADAGVQILRVHDVAATVQALRIWRALRA